MKLNVEQLAKNCSIPPIVFAARAKDKCLSLVWICVLIGFSTLSLVQTFQLLQKLNLQEKYASVTITSQPLAPFPSVTICNINAYRRSALEALPEFKTYFQLLGMQSNGNQSSNTQNTSFRTGRKKRAPTPLGTCPTNFTNVAVDYPKICYTDVINQTLTFNNALLACKALFSGSTLPTFRTSLEYSSYQILMQTKYMKVCSTDVWFGLMSNQTDDVFRWVDGASNMTFFHWDINQPNQTSMAGLTHHSVGGNWQTYPLNSALRAYVCQLRLANAAQTPKSIQKFQNDPRCPADAWTYDNISDICYSSRFSQTSWFNATSTCAQLGPNVSLPYFCNSSEFDSYIQFMYKNCWTHTHLSLLWLGYSGCAGTSFIMANGQASPFLSFPPAAAQNYSQCVIFDFTKTPNSSWVSYDCSTLQSYFCQYRPSDNLCPNSPQSLEICESTTTNPIKSVSSLVSIKSSTSDDTTSAITTSSTIQQTTLSIQCPKNFSYAADYPNLCYTGIVGKLSFSQSHSFCANLNPQSTLPIFRRVSEYDSYRLLIYLRQNLFMASCWKYVWLDLMYDTSSSTNFTWGDQTVFNFGFQWDFAQPNLAIGNAAKHGLSGPWMQSENENASLEFICQLRLYELSNPAQSIKIFESNNICPNTSWSYDNKSNICYSTKYFSKTWLDADTYCNSLFPNTSLPYFCSYAEFEGYIKYINQTLLYCNGNTWLAYGCNGASFVHWDPQSGEQYYAWAPSYPLTNECSVFDYSVLQRNQSWYTIDCSITSANFFCQYRPSGNVCLGVTSVPCSEATTSVTQQSTSTKDTSSTTALNELMYNLEYNVDDDALAQMTKMSEGLAYIIGQLSLEERMKLGYSLDQMLMHCKFNNHYCDKKNFVTWNEPSIGNCFTFNQMNTVDQIQTKAGTDYGLDLLFNTTDKDYINSTLSVGLKLFLQFKSNAIFFDTEAMSIPSGYILDVPLKYTKVKRLAFPFGDCISAKDETTYMFDGSYTAEGCVKNCQQRSALNNCGCFDPNLPAPTRVNAEKKFCNITKQRCVSSTMNDFQSNTDGKNCTCSQPCQDNIYKKIPSITKWRQLVGKTYYQQVAAIRIYYTKLSYIQLEETPAYDIATFIADFGNIVGMNIGVAFHSIFEILMIILAFLISLFAG